MRTCATIENKVGDAHGKSTRVNLLKSDEGGDFFPRTAVCVNDSAVQFSFLVEPSTT